MEEDIGEAKWVFTEMREIGEKIGVDWNWKQKKEFNMKMETDDTRIRVDGRLVRLTPKQHYEHFKAEFEK